MEVVRTPKYAAVRQGLLERITMMPVGERLPAEPVLCQEFGVSRITLRRAVDGLVRDGRLERQQGRGTFVAAAPVSMRYPERFTDAVTGFYRQQVDAGRDVTTRVLHHRLAHADEGIAARLLLPFAARVIELVRLRYVNGELHHHVVTYLSYEQFPDLLDHDFTAGSLFEQLHARYRVTLARNDLAVGVVPAPADVATHLDVPVTERLLRIDSTVFSVDGEVVASGYSHHTPSNSEITLSLRATGREEPRDAADLP